MENIEVLQERANKARSALWEAEKRERAKEHRALVGKHFKYRNSHSGEARWWLYGKVVAVENDMLVMFEFQTDAHDAIEIRPAHKSMSLLGGFKPIPKREFDTEWRKVAKRIASFIP